MSNETFSEEKLRDILNRHVVSKVSGVEKQLIDFQESFKQTSQTILDDVTRFLTSIEDAALEDLRTELSQFGRSLRGQVEAELRPTLTQEIRQQVEEELRPALAQEIQQRVESDLRPALTQQLREQLEANLRPALAREIREELGRESESRLEEAAKANRSAVENQFDTKMQLLANAVQEISQQQTQVNILNSYLNQAAQFAPRVGFFVVKANSLIGWKAKGFDGDFKNESFKNLHFTVDRYATLEEVCTAQRPFKGNALAEPGLAELVSKFGPVAPDAIYIVPLVVREKVVALLYTDSGLAPNQPVDTHLVDILTRVVSATVELGSTRAKLGIKPTEPAQAEPDAAVHAPAPAMPVQEAPAPVMPPPPIVPPAPVEKEKFVPPAPPAPEPPVEEAEPVPVQVEAAPAPPPPAPPAAAPAALVAGPVVSDDMDETEKKLHHEAYRFAKLLVTEVKLYNEQKVTEGRRNCNLYELLHDDIDRSREMYDKRVNPVVASKIDYFYRELVRILANNEPEALGKEHIGPNLLQ